MRKGEKRRQELLKIAYGLFLRQGYEETSVDEIIREAGIAKGTFYYHFGSKEQILEEVIYMMLDAEEARARALMAADIPLPQKLVGIIASFRPEAGELPIQDALNRPENLLMHEKINRQMVERMVPLLSAVAEQGVAEGLFACDRIPQRVRIIIILSIALFDERHFDGADADVFIDTVERILYAQPGTMGFIRQLIR